MSKEYMYCISITPQGYFGVYAWQEYHWVKLRAFMTRREADTFFNEIADLPKFK